MDICSEHPGLMKNASVGGSICIDKESFFSVKTCVAGQGQVDLLVRAGLTLGK